MQHHALVPLSEWKDTKLSIGKGKHQPRDAALQPAHIRARLGRRATTAVAVHPCLHYCSLGHFIDTLKCETKRFYMMRLFFAASS